MKTYKLSIQLKTSSKDPKQALKEVKEFWERTKKYDHSKVSISTSVADIVNDPDYEIDPHVHEFVFLSDDKAELQKMADDFNRLHYPNFKKNDPDSLGVRVTKNTQGVREESSKKIKAEESEKQPVKEDLKSDFEKKCVYCKDCKYAHMTYDGETKYCDFFQPDGGDSLYLPAGSFCSNGKKK